MTVIGIPSYYYKQELKYNWIRTNTKIIKLVKERLLKILLKMKSFLVMKSL